LFGSKVLLVFAARHIGAGEHNGLVIAVALAGEPLPCVERPDVADVGLPRNLPEHVLPRPRNTKPAGGDGGLR
jgi:hypothetical protein